MSKLFVAEYPNLKPNLWARNCHVQTLAAFVLGRRQSLRIPSRRIVSLADEDRLVVHDDAARNWITGDRIAILIHGLCGCHNSSYVRRAAIRLRQHGIRTIRIDMRGFGDSALISTGHLHAGCSDDLKDVVEYVHQFSPLSKISLVGFSLGANIVLRTLAQWSTEHPKYVDSAIAISPPIDLARCSANLRARGNRMYEYYFVKRLKNSLAWRRQRVANLVDNGLNPLPDRLVHFDDQFTAPVNGFSGAREYYGSCSPIGQLKQVQIPTIIVAAQDDPVIPFEMFDPSVFSSQIEFVSTRNGGHLGFLGQPQRDPDRHWLDWRICHWLSGMDAK